VFRIWPSDIEVGIGKLESVSAILTIGIVILGGFVCGELAKVIGLPKVTGFIVAGIFLSPSFSHVVPPDFTEHTDLITNIALAFITFSVGGTLHYGRVRRLGRSILTITLFEAEFAFLVSGIGLLALAPLIVGGAGASWAGTYIPLALLLGCLASPTACTVAERVCVSIKEYSPKTSPFESLDNSVFSSKTTTSPVSIKYTLSPFSPLEITISPSLNSKGVNKLAILDSAGRSVSLKIFTC